MEEVWEDIPEYEGFYKVSNLGRVKSLPRNGTIQQERIMINKITKQGYVTVHLRKLGVSKYLKIHRLVALTFLNNPENKPQVNHKDGNKENNNLSNLEWMTVSENVQHAFDTGLNTVCLEQIAEARRKSNISCTKRVAKFDLEGNELERFDSMTEARKSLGKSSSSMLARSCTQGKTAYGFMWRYL